MITASCLGHIGRDAERIEAGGNTAAKFSLACNPGKKDGETQWVSCIIWGKRGEVLLEYLKKGTPIFASGELTKHEYQGKDGGNKSTLNLNVSMLEFAGKARTQEPKEDLEDVEIPF